MKRVLILVILATFNHARMMQKVAARSKEVLAPISCIGSGAYQECVEQTINTEENNIEKIDLEDAIRDAERNARLASINNSTNNNQNLPNQVIKTTTNTQSNVDTSYPSHYPLAISNNPSTTTIAPTNISTTLASQTNATTENHNISNPVSVNNQPTI